MKKNIKTISIDKIMDKNPGLKEEIDKEIKQEEEIIKKALESGDELVYVKDNEGYVTRKLKSKIQDNEKIITKKQFEKDSGLEYYEKTFGRGGARPNAGRRKQYKDKIKETYEIERQESDSLKSYAKKHGISKNQAIALAIKKLVS